MELSGFLSGLIFPIVQAYYRRVFVHHGLYESVGHISNRLSYNSDLAVGKADDVFSSICRSPATVARTA